MTPPFPHRKRKRQEDYDDDDDDDDGIISCVEITTPTPPRIRTITGIDPGVRNFSLYKYDLATDKMCAWLWVDIMGLRRSKLTSKEIVDRLDEFIKNNPKYFDLDLIVVEKQMVINTKNINMQRYLEKRFEGRCKVVCPKKTFRNLLERMGKDDTQELIGVTLGDSIPRNQKKKIAVKMGKIMMNGDERRMFKIMTHKNKEWAKTVKEYDERMLNSRRTTKKPRRTKAQPDDVFDAFILTLIEASNILGKNIIYHRIHWRRLLMVQALIAGMAAGSTNDDAIIL